MLLDPGDWSLDQRFGELRERLSPELAERLTTETHGATIEYETEPHPTRRRRLPRSSTVLRALLADELRGQGAAVAGLGHPPVHDLGGDRALARRALPIRPRDDARARPARADVRHARPRRGADPELAIATANRMRVHLPLLLALSANSPFWLGRDSGLASARTPIFWGFPRTGHPARLRRLRRLRATARDPDRQRRVSRSRASSGGTCACARATARSRSGSWTPRPRSGGPPRLRRSTQSLVRMEALEPRAPAELVEAPELLEENGFRAARDGVRAAAARPARAPRPRGRGARRARGRGLPPARARARLRARARRGAAPDRRARRHAPARDRWRPMTTSPRWSRSSPRASAAAARSRRSTARAQRRPSAIAVTISDWPTRASPAA